MGIMEWLKNGEQRMKKIISIISILLMSTMILSSTHLFFGNSASAATGAANFLPNYSVSGLDTANETAISISTFQYVTSVLNSRYSNCVFYDLDTTKNSFNSKLGMVQSYYDKVVVFSKGHRGVPAPGHVSLVDKSGLTQNQITDYYDIYLKTSASKNVFTFIWHCETAYPYVPNGVNWDSVGVKGMPYAWTQNVGMAKYGNAGSQVYLGWNHRIYVQVYNYETMHYEHAMVMGGYLIGSPQYEWGITPKYNYANVAGLIWSNLGGGNSTSTSLDNTSKLIYGKPFATNNDLYDWLIVWGNGNMGLPT
jgi:hypothetical protein